MKRGFTLVELLAVLVILGLLGMIVVPIIDKSLKESKDSLYETQVKNIIDSSKNWASENLDNLPNEGEVFSIDINTLKNEGYISDVINPKTKEPMNGCVKITYTSSNKQYNYEYLEECSAISFMDKIKNSVGSSGNGTLERIEESATTETSAVTDYRYRGANPNNYVTFNDELWRIIGIVDGKVKLIKSESIGEYPWNSNLASDGLSVNQWLGSTLQVYLNGEYYNGLNSKAKEMIDSSTWYLGGWDTYTVTPSLQYSKERGTAVYNCRRDDGQCPRNTNWSGFVGLMYPSDYGYAASSSCLDNYTLDNYHNETCSTNNWLYNNKYQWTLSPSSGYALYAFLLRTQAAVPEDDHVKFIFDVRPTVYLKENVKFSYGTGKMNNPYVIG